MTKRIVLLFCVFAAMILPASAAKARAHKHSIARSSRSKSIRKSTHSRKSKSVSGKKRSSAHPQKLRKR